MKKLIQSIFILTGLLMSTAGAEDVIYAKVGETVTLRTNVSSRYETWTFGNEHGIALAWSGPFGKHISTELEKEWKERLSLTDAGLVIKDIQQQHFGTFTKVHKNNDKIPTITYRVVRVSVFRSPDGPLLPGETVTLTCDTDAPESLKPQIYWLNPQGIKLDKNKLARGGKLTQKSTSRDHGRWTCVITTAKKEQLSVVVVDLSPAPPGPLYTSESSRLNIPFSTLVDLPWKQIKERGGRGVRWHFFPLSPGLVSGDGQRLFQLSLEDPLRPSVRRDQHRGLSVSHSYDKGNLSLTRRQARVEDRGDYVCSLESENGRIVNRTVHVEVLQLFSSPTQIVSGHRVNLTCSLGHALPPNAWLKWIPPQSSSLRPRPANDSNPACFAIPAAAAGDGGTWRCELWRGGTLLTAAVIALKIEPRLSAWMLVTICAATVIVILVCILILVSCRRRRRLITRHPRNRVCHCKIPKPKGFYKT